MKKRKLRIILYVFSIALLLGGVYGVEQLIKSDVFKGESVDMVEKVVPNEEPVIEDVPVVATQSAISRPYNNGSVKILKKFYDYKGEESAQEDSLVYYGNTYLQNSGVDYGMETEFEVLSILDGTVMEVLDDEVMGKTVKIKHNDDLISVYQSLGSVDVSVDTPVVQGAVIGKSGLSNVSSDLGNHLHFEIYYQGKVLNPEDCFDKLPGDLK